MIPEEQLNAAEKKVLDAFRAGEEIVELENKKIRGDFLHRLFCEDYYGKINHRKTIIYKAEISDVLSMAFCKTRFPVQFLYCTFIGKVNLEHFECPVLNFEMCYFRKGIDASNVKIEGDVQFIGCRSFGMISLRSAQIGGYLHCKGGVFINKGKTAIYAYRLKVTADVVMNHGFRAIGTVNLVCAEIGGQLDCRNGRFMHRRGISLFAQRIKITANMFISEGFRSTGEVVLSGAEIGGQLACHHVILANKKGKVLTAQSVKVGSSLILGDELITKGRMNLYGSRIHGGLQLVGCQFTGIILHDVQVGTFIDNASSYSAVKAGYLQIDGFCYQQLKGDWEEEDKVKSRLMWLNLIGDNDEFHPQPYEQLMKVYRDMGHTNWARKVGFALEEKRRKCLQWLRNPLWKSWQWILRLTIGYGYRPFRAFFGWFPVLVFIGSLFFGGALPCSKYFKDWAECDTWHMLPLDTRVLLSDDWKANKQIPEGYPPFITHLYAVEVVFPVLPLGQTDKWHPETLLAKSLQSFITTVGAVILAILVLYGVGTLGPRWRG